MKKTIGFFLAMCISGVLFAQNLILTHVDSIVTSHNPTAELIARVFVKNNTLGTLSISTKRLSKKLAFGHASSFCNGTNCYGYSTNQSANPDQVQPNKVDSGFTSDLFPDTNGTGYYGKDTVRYCFYAGTDSVFFRIIYNITPPTGIQNQNENVAYISKPSPNPVVDVVRFNYYLPDANKKAVVQVFNLLGSVVKQIEVPNKEGTLSISTAEFNPGLYFYNFVVDGQAMTTQKFIITSK